MVFNAYDYSDASSMIERSRSNATSLQQYNVLTSEIKEEVNESTDMSKDTIRLAQENQYLAAQLKESNDMIQKLLSRMDSKEDTIIE